ncbi:MAG: right-handed parallel beta-helix repeat-containing protein [Rhizobium rhizophilum]|uniref:right-handed parallel beta-helix repeat-containing protein n=1 Tax=Rhizobium rhizophilum TaxID=1850373 RepID=UPI00391DE5BD
MRKGLPLLLALLLTSTAPGLRAESLDRAELAGLTRTVAEIGARLQSVDTRKDDARELLTGRLAMIDRTEAAPRPALHRLTTVGKLQTVPIDFMLAQLRLQTARQFDTEIEKALVNRAAPALFIRGGAMTLDQLAAEAEKLFPGAVERRGETILSRWPIVIWSDSALVIEPQQSLELSTADGAFLLNSGLLTVDGGELKASAGQNSGLNSFRPFVATAMTGALQASGARFSRLGYAGAGSTSGLSILGAALFPSKITSHVVDSSFENVSGLSLENTHRMLVAGNRFSGGAGPAIAMKGVTGADISANIITGTTETQAIDIQNTSSSIRVAGNILLGNRGSGVFVANDARDVSITGNLMSRNGRGGVSVVRSACVTISHNVMLSNSQVGIKVRASHALTLSHNDLIANAGAGISIIDQDDNARVAIDGNAFSANKSGIHGGAASEVALKANDFAGQSPILLDGEFAPYVPELLETAASADAKPKALTIHANTSSAAPVDCKTGS